MSSWVHTYMCEKREREREEEIKRMPKSGIPLISGSRSGCQTRMTWIIYLVKFLLDYFFLSQGQLCHRFYLIIIYFARMLCIFDIFKHWNFVIQNNKSFSTITVYIITKKKSRLYKPNICKIHRRLSWRHSRFSKLWFT